MAKRKPHVLDDLPDVAGFFGVTERTIGKWFDAGCPCRGGPYDLYVLVDWWAHEKIQPNNKDQSAVDELKTRRLEQQYRSDELNYALRIDELMLRRDVELILDQVASEFRQAGESLLKQYGQDAQAIISEALDNAGQILMEKFKKT